MGGPQDAIQRSRCGGKRYTTRPYQDDFLTDGKLAHEVVPCPGCPECPTEEVDGMTITYERQRAQEAEAAFRKIIEEAENHDSLVRLQAAGWVEQCPWPEHWRFTHPDHPGVEIDWNPGHLPRARTAPCQHDHYVTRGHPDGGEQPFCRECDEFVDL